MISKRTIFLLVASLWLGYVVVRAVTTPLVHDEAATFFNYVHPGEFVPGFAHWDANNHILLSGAAILSYSIFGAEEWALRLPSLLAALLFLFCVWELSRFFKSRTVQWIFIISLLGAHYFAEFFSLSRGYGMSMGFLLASLLFLFRYLKNNSNRNALFALVFMGLSLATNLTLINSALILLTFLAVGVVHSNRQSIPERIITLAYFGVLPIVGSVLILLHMRELELLYYGVGDGFWEVTVSSLLENLIGTSSIPAGIAVVVLAIIPLIAAWMQLRKIGLFPSLLKPDMVFTWLFFGNLAAVFLAHFLLDINYPADRTGLFFFPFLIGGFCFALDFLIRRYKSRAVLLLALPLLYLPIYFISSANTTHNQFWVDEGIPEEFYEKYLEEQTPDQHPGTLGGHFIREMCSNWHNFSNGGTSSYLQSAGFQSDRYDFLIAESYEIPEWRHLYDTLASEPISGLALLKRKEPIVYQPVQTIEGVEGSTNSEFLNLLVHDVTAVRDKRLKLDVSLHIESESKPLKSWLVATLMTAEEEQITYQRIPLGWIRTNWNGSSTPLKQSFILHRIPENAGVLKVYLWNRDRAELHISNGTLQIQQDITPLN